MAQGSGISIKELANKSFKSSLILLGTDPLDSEVSSRIPTGWTLLDFNMGGGLPVGRLVEIYGAESTGKSTLVLHAMKNCQDLGGTVVVFDPESTFYKEIAEKLGINMGEVLFVSPKIPLEDLFTVFVKMIELVRQEKPDGPVLIVWDTLAATPTKKEIEEQDDSGRMTPQYRAQVIRKGLRSIVYKLAEANVCLVVINQVYDRPTMGGIVVAETPGGRGVKFHSSVRVHLKNLGMIKETQDSPPVGIHVMARVEKNKLGAPRREFTTRLIYGEGFSDEYSLFDYSVESGLIEKSGSWYSLTFNNKKIKFYAKDFLTKLADNEGLLEELRGRVLSHYVKQM